VKNINPKVSWPSVISAKGMELKVNKNLSVATTELCKSRLISNQPKSVHSAMDYIYKKEG